MKLEIGDIIKRFELTTEIEHVYEIISLTKTQAKTKCGKRFQINTNENVTKINENCHSEANIIGYKGSSARYFLIKKQ